MHIEPGVVNGVKIGLSYVTGATAIALGLKMIIQQITTNTSMLETGLRCLITTILVFSFFVSNDVTHERNLYLVWVRHKVTIN